MKGSGVCDRDLVVVDVETSGLDVDKHRVLEVAAVNVRTGEELCFAPRVDDWFVHAEPEALGLNRYFERGVFRWMLRTQEQNARFFEALNGMLGGNVFAGVNPSFDDKFLRKEFERAGVSPSWSFQNRDLVTFFCGVRGHNPAELLPARKVFQELGVVNTDPHSALGDARAAAAAFRVLIDEVQGR